MGMIEMKNLQQMIDSADSSELNEIVRCVLHRYDELFADEEVVFLSLPKHHKEERQRIIRAVLQMEQHHE